MLSPAEERFFAACGEAPFDHPAYRSGRLLVPRRLGRRRRRGSIAFSLALRGLFVLSALLFIAAGAGRPVTFTAVSVVIRPKYHEILT
jgi:hypothetical protein